MSRLGWTPEEAAELVKREYQRLELIIKEKKYPSFAAAARQLAPHIPVTTAYRRYHHSGWTIEQALDLSFGSDLFHRKKNGGIPVMIRGVKYKSIQKAYMKLKPNIKISVIYSRIKKGFLVEDAFFTERNKISKTLYKI